MIETAVFGISKTVERPLGIAAKGNLVSVLRYQETVGAEEKVAHVRSFDVLSGALMKPRMSTLKMTLYLGGGAGKEGFVPPLENYLCDCSIKKAFDSNGNESECGSVCSASLSLQELDHKVTLYADGTVMIERIVNLNPDSSLWMWIDFDEVYLPFQKMPADPNRGIDLFPSRATFALGQYSHTTLYSDSLLIMPPVPDMSMPFNVISLSCTLWAFVLGSL